MLDKDDGICLWLVYHDLSSLGNLGWTCCPNLSIKYGFGYEILSHYILCMLIIDNVKDPLVKDLLFDLVTWTVIFKIIVLLLC